MSVSTEEIISQLQVVARDMRSDRRAWDARVESLEKWLSECPCDTCRIIVKAAVMHALSHGVSIQTKIRETESMIRSLEGSIKQKGDLR